MLPHFPNYQTQSPAKNFSLLLGILLIDYAAIWFLETSPILTSVIIAIPSALFLWYTRSKKLLFVGLCAALIGTGHEVLFVAKGYWYYHQPDFLGVPLYLPLVWATIGLLSVAIYKGIRLISKKYTRWHQPPRFPLAILYTLLTLFLALVAIYFLAPQPWWLVLCFLLIDVLYIWSMRSLPLALVGIFTFAAGAVADLVSVPLGIWGYPPTTAALFGVPIYIFIGWDVIGILLAGIYASLETRDLEPNPGESQGI